MVDNLTEVPKTLENMNLDKARGILSRVVGVTELVVKKPAKDGSDDNELARQELAELIEIPGYNSQEIAQVIQTVADDLCPLVGVDHGGLQRDLGDNWVLLERTKSPQNPSQETITLVLAEGGANKTSPGKSIIDTRVILNDKGLQFEGSDFQDYRLGERGSLDEAAMVKEKWQGVRWLIDNLLQWKGKFRLPEQLPGGRVKLSFVPDDHQKPTNIITFPKKVSEPRF